MIMHVKPMTSRRRPNPSSIWLEKPTPRYVSYLELYGWFLQAKDAGLIDRDHLRADTLGELVLALSDAGIIRTGRH